MIKNGVNKIDIIKDSVISIKTEDSKNYTEFEKTLKSLILLNKKEFSSNK